MMPAYNAGTYIRQAIQSVLDQSYTNWELVIIDDGSTDQTNAIVSGYIDSRIKVVRQENRGEAAARNNALRNIQGEYLAFLDSDDIYLPQHLEVTIGYLSTHEHVDGVYTDGYHIDLNENLLQTLSSRRRGPFEGNLFEEVLSGSDVFGPPVCVVLRTSLIEQYGLKFDENIVIGPDWDFFIKYAESANFSYIDQITCLYRLHTSNITIRTGLEKRALELSKCRINAIKMKNFRKCSTMTQVSVFYDLLINLLLDLPGRQTEITQWPEFLSLPKTKQAELLRWMASTALIYGKDHTFVKYWLRKSLHLNLADFRSTLLWIGYHIHPKLLSTILKLRFFRKIDPRAIQPFADMKIME